MGALSPAAAILGTVLTAALVACSPSGSGTVAGTVTTEDGSPPSGCSVSAVPGDDVDQPVPEYAAVPDGRGRYEYRLPVGSYEVVATCETGSDSATVRIASGRTTAWPHLRPGVSLSPSEVVACTTASGTAAAATSAWG